MERSEARYRASEALQETLLENSSDVITIVGTDGTLRYVSPAVRRILGYDPAELLGKGGFDLVHPDDTSSLLALFANRCDPSSQETAAEYRVRRADGSWVWVESVGRNLLEDPTVQGFVSNTREITERRELEQQRSDFIAMLTHDIRNPVGIIAGSLDMLREEGGLSAESADIVRRMEDSVQTVLSLATSYLDLSKIESGELTLNRTALALDTVVAKVAERHRIEATRRGIYVRLQLDPLVPKIEGDPVALERVFENLLHNALKFTPDGGRVTVTVAAPNDCVVCSVSDTGRGIAPEDLCNVFQRYRQTDTGRAKGGTGLGLFIAKSLIEAHGGTVRVESTVGKGTRFTLCFPLTPDSPPP